MGPSVRIALFAVLTLLFGGVAAADVEIASPTVAISPDDTPEPSEWIDVSHSAGVQRSTLHLLVPFALRCARTASPPMSVARTSSGGRNRSAAVAASARNGIGDHSLRLPTPSSLPTQRRSMCSNRFACGCRVRTIRIQSV